MIGRFFIGIGVGTGFAIDPIYIAEISPAVHRGGLVTWSELATNFGIVLGFISLLVYSPFDDGFQWRLMLGTGGILPVVMIYLSSYVMIESPRWLVAKNRIDEAEQVLTRLYPEGKYIEQDLSHSIFSRRMIIFVLKFVHPCFHMPICIRRFCGDQCT